MTTNTLCCTCVSNSGKSGNPITHYQKKKKKPVDWLRKVKPESYYNPFDLINWLSLDFREIFQFLAVLIVIILTSPVHYILWVLDMPFSRHWHIKWYPSGLDKCQNSMIWPLRSMMTMQLLGMLTTWHSILTQLAQTANMGFLSLATSTVVLWEECCMS